MPGGKVELCEELEPLRKHPHLMPTAAVAMRAGVLLGTELLADAVAEGLGRDGRRFRRHTAPCAGGEGSARCRVAVWW